MRTESLLVPTTNENQGIGSQEVGSISSRRGSVSAPGIFF